MPPLTKAARNERTKITGTFLNNLAVALMVTAVIVPTVSWSFSPFDPMRRGWWSVIASLDWGLMSIYIHFVSRRWLRRIEE